MYIWRLYDHQNLFSIAAILDLFLGLAWIVFPEAMLAFWGTSEANAMMVYMSRRYAVLFFGYAITLWFSRSSPPSAARNAIVAGAFFVCVLIGAMSLIGFLTSTINAWGVLSFAIELTLAAGFGYFLFARREPTTQGQAAPLR